jgi:hypothetical protein
MLTKSLPIRASPSPDLETESADTIIYRLPQGQNWRHIDSS